jgi:pterin-4a-carbinolamine dehydratase
MATGSISSSSPRSPRDPTARRPNQKCDPYGQGGKPLTLSDAQKLLTTVDKEWRLDLGPQQQQQQRAPTINVENNDGSPQGHDDNDDNDLIVPHALYKEFYHKEFLDGSAFLHKVAAVAQMNNAHFPTLHLERRIVPRRKEWQVVSTVQCRTKVLEGLSHHDFFLAMVRDVKLVVSCQGFQLGVSVSPTIRRPSGSFLFFLTFDLLLFGICFAAD